MYFKVSLCHISRTGHSQGYYRLVESYRNQFKRVLGERPLENAYMTDMLQEIIIDGYPVKAVPVCSPWVEVDTVEVFESDVTKQRLYQI